MRSVETVMLLVVVATVVATFARRLAVPAPSLLVVAGVLIGLVPGVPEIRVTPEIVSLVVLPPLLYAAGEEMPWRELRAVWRPVTVLAVGLVLFTAAVVGFVAPAVAPLTASMAFVLGAVLASTDPVAVAALGRRLALPTRLQVLVQAESLFNDATSLVLFRVAVTAAVAGGAIAPGRAVGQFALLVVGGTVVGIVVSAGVAAVRRRTEDPVLDVIVISLVVQGFTLAPLVRRAGIAREPAIGAEEDAAARLQLVQAGIDYLEQLEVVGGAAPVVIERARRSLLGRRDRIAATLDGDQPGDPVARAYRRLRRDLLDVERTELHRLYDRGAIGEATRRRVERLLDLEDAALGDD